VALCCLLMRHILSRIGAGRTYRPGNQGLSCPDLRITSARQPKIKCVFIFIALPPFTWFLRNREAERLTWKWH
jgi:hypothetical protein